MTARVWEGEAALKERSRRSDGNREEEGEDRRHLAYSLLN